MTTSVISTMLAFESTARGKAVVPCIRLASRIRCGTLFLGRDAPILAERKPFCSEWNNTRWWWTESAV